MRRVNWGCLAAIVYTVIVDCLLLLAVAKVLAWL